MLQLSLMYKDEIHRVAKAPEQELIDLTHRSAKRFPAVM